MNNLTSDDSLEWIAKLEDIVASLDVLEETYIERAPEHIDFRVWVEVSDVDSAATDWARTLVKTLRAFGLDARTGCEGYTRALKRKFVDEADALVVAVTDASSLVEAVRLSTVTPSRSIVCHRPQETPQSFHRSLWDAQIETIEYAESLVSKNVQRLPIDIFRQLSDRIAAKKADNTKALRMAQTVIVLISGLFSHAAWMDTMVKIFKGRGLVVKKTNPDGLGLRALLFSRYRRRPIENIWTDLSDVINTYKGHNVCVIAHSFGTFIFGSLFEKHSFCVDKVILCGSILPVRYRFEDFAGKFSRIVNEVGSRDFWPAFACSINSSYGPTGSTGFRRPVVEDRFHKDMSHNGFMTTDFCEKFWLPFFTDNDFIEGDVAQLPTFFVRAVINLKIRYVLYFAVAAAVLGLARPALSAVLNLI